MTYDASVRTVQNRKCRKVAGGLVVFLAVMLVVEETAVPAFAGRTTSITSGWRAGTSNSSKPTPNNSVTGYSIFLTRFTHTSSTVNYTPGYWQTSPLDGTDRAVQRWEASWRYVTKNHYLGGADGISLGFVPVGSAGVANELGSGRDGVWFSFDTWYGGADQERVSVYRNGSRVVGATVPTTALKSDRWHSVKAVLEATSTQSATVSLQLNGVTQFRESIAWNEYAGVFNFGARVGASASLHEVTDFDLVTYAPDVAVLDRLSSYPGATSTLDFGSVRVGASQFKSAYVHNTGGVQTTLRGTLSADAGDVFRASSRSVAVYRSTSVRPGYATTSFTFRPQVRGEVSESRTADTNGGSAAFTLQGTGVGPAYSASFSGQTLASGDEIDFGVSDVGSDMFRSLWLRNLTSDT